MTAASLTGQSGAAGALPNGSVTDALGRSNGAETALAG
jgi:hypothetical protein